MITIGFLTVMRVIFFFAVLIDGVLLYYFSINFNFWRAFNQLSYELFILYLF